jgi:hypothetical protein
LKGLDLTYLNTNNATPPPPPTMATAATTMPVAAAAAAQPTGKKNKGKKGKQQQAPVVPAAVSEEGAVAVAAGNVKVNVVTLKPLQTRLGLFFGRLDPPTPLALPAASAAVAMANGASKGKNGTEKAMSVVKDNKEKVSRVGGGGGVSGGSGEGDNGGYGGDSSGGASAGGAGGAPADVAQRGVALVRQAMDASKTRAAADDAVASLASSGVLADDKVSGWWVRS